jgi:hypothetical protein
MNGSNDLRWLRDLDVLKHVTQAARICSMSDTVAFRCHINPALGRQELQHVLKHVIEAMWERWQTKARAKPPSGVRSC